MVCCKVYCAVLCCGAHNLQVQKVVESAPQHDMRPVAESCVLRLVWSLLKVKTVTSSVGGLFYA